MLGQFYIQTTETPIVHICVKSTSPYSWAALLRAEDLTAFRSIYDSNNNDIVDNAEKLGGNLPSYYLAVNQKGIANGVASLDSGGKVPASQLDFTAINNAISAADAKAGSAQRSADTANTAITELTTRMTAAEGNISTLNTSMAGIRQRVLKSVSYAVADWTADTVGFKLSRNMSSFTVNTMVLVNFSYDPAITPIAVIDAIESLI